MGKETLDRLDKNKLGRAALFTVEIGMTGYFFWRFYQIIWDRENNVFDRRGIINRPSYFSTAVFYNTQVSLSSKSRF